jgi:uncharacterized oligopeptide transporter (OPT) family protein
MATVVQGVIGGNIPWTPIMVGAFIALGIELLGINSLPVAIGLYLPLSLSSPIMLGGIVSLLIKKTSRIKEFFKSRQESGILFASGLVAGGGLIGVASAFLIGGSPGYKEFYDNHEISSFIFGGFGEYLSLIMIAGLAVTLFMAARRFGNK